MTAKERWKYKHWWPRAWQFSDSLGLRIFVLQQLDTRHLGLLRKAWVNWQKRNSSLEKSLITPAINKYTLHTIQKYTKKLEQEVLNETTDD